MKEQNMIWKIMMVIMLLMMGMTSILGTICEHGSLQYKVHTMTQQHNTTIVEARGIMIENKIHIIGGYDAIGDTIIGQQLYDYIEGKLENTIPNAPTFLGTQIGYNETKKILYLFGGMNGLEAISQNLYTYDVTHNQWGAPIQMNERVAYAAYVHIHGMLHMFGGITVNNTNNNNYRTIDMNNEQQPSLNLQNVQGLDHDISHWDAVHHGSTIYFYGGKSAVEVKQTLYAYGIQSGNMSEPQPIGIGIGKRAGYASVLVGNNWYMTGGIDNTQNTVNDTLHRLNLEAMQWEHVPITWKLGQKNLFLIHYDNALHMVGSNSNSPETFMINISEKKCTCDPGYAGLTCDTPICKEPCQQGGTCILPDTCQCNNSLSYNVSYTCALKHATCEPQYKAWLVNTNQDVYHENGASVTYKGVMYLIFGEDRTSLVNAITTYNQTFDSFSQLTFHELSDARQPVKDQHCVVYHHQAYCYGGYHDGFYSSQLTSLDFLTQTWRVLEVSGINDKRSAGATVLVNDTMYMIMGRIDGDETDTTMTIQLDTLTTETNTNCPVEVAYHSAVYNAKNDTIYLFGGYSPATGTTAHTLLYTIKPSSTVDTKSFTTSPSPRYKHKALYYQDAMYILGGNSGQSELKDMWRLNIEKWEWAMVSADINVTLSKSHLGVIDQQAVIYGGYHGQDIFKLALDTCHCDTGYYGMACDQPICVGSDPCFGHGTCIAPDTCTCETPYDPNTHCQYVVNHTITTSKVNITLIDAVVNVANPNIFYDLSQLHVLLGDQLDNSQVYTLRDSPPYNQVGQVQTSYVMQGATCVQKNTHAYCFGGVPQTNTNLSKLSRFHFPSLQWQVLSTSGDQPSSRFYAASLLHGQHILLFGGLINTVTSYKEIYQIHLESLEWQLNAMMPQSLSYLSATRYSAAGVLTYGHTPEQVDPIHYALDSHQTSYIATTQKPTQFGGHVAHYYNGTIYFLGGFSNSIYFNTIHKLSTTTWVWSMANTTLPTPAAHFGFVPLKDNTLFLLGGQTSNNIFPYKMIISLSETQCRQGHGGDACQYHYCNGILSKESTVCSGHGNCSDVDTCTCDNFYQGPNCEDHRCGSIVHTNSSVCSGHGNCSEPNHCDCDEGYAGDTCDVFQCFGISHTNTSACHGHGVCVAPNECQCNDYYEGQNCSKFTCYGIQSDDSNVCSNHGECVNPNSCNCTGQYAGSHCQLNVNFMAYLNESITLCDPVALTLEFADPTLFNAPSIIKLSLIVFVDDLVFYQPDDILLDSAYQVITLFDSLTLPKFRVMGSIQLETPLVMIESFPLNMTETTVACPTTPDNVNVYGIENSKVTLAIPESSPSCLSLTATSNDGLTIETMDNTIEIVDGLTYRETPYMISTSYNGGCKYRNYNITTVKKGVIHAIIQGGSRTTSLQVHLDGSSSFTTYDMLPLKYQWYCSPKQENTMCPSFQNNGETLDLNFNNEGLFSISLMVYNSLGSHMSEPVLLNVSSMKRIAPMLNARDTFSYSKTPLTFVATIDNAAGAAMESIKYQWYYRNATGESYLPLSTEQIIGELNSPIITLINQWNLIDIKCITSSVDALSGYAFTKIIYIAPPQFDLMVTPWTIEKGKPMSVVFTNAHSTYYPTLYYSVEYEHQNKTHYLVYDSTSPQFDILVPLVGASPNFTVPLLFTVSDGQGGRTTKKRYVTVLPTNATYMPLSSKLQNVTNLSMKVQHTLIHLSSNDPLSDNDANITLNVLDDFSTSDHRVFIQSNAMRTLQPKLNASNDYLLKRMLSSISKSIVVLKENTDFQKARETSTNFFSILSEIMTKNKSDPLLTNLVHQNVNGLVSFMDSHILLGEVPYVQSSSTMNISIVKERLSTLSTSPHIPIALPKSIEQSLQNQAAAQGAPISTKRGVSMIYNQFNYIPNDNSTTKFNQMIDLSFTNGQSKLHLANLSEPIHIAFMDDVTNLTNYEANKPYYQATCIYFNESASKWLSNGLQFANGTCISSHTTEFAIDLTLILPQFNIIDLEKHSITKLNTDNMTVTLILCGLLFFYVMLLCLFQVLDLVTACIARMNVKTQPNMPIGYLDASGHKHYVIPIFQRLRDIHQWISVILSPNAPDRTYSKQQRLTVLLVLILGIMMSNALTVGIGADNESIYVTACIVADLITQPFALLAAFMFLKLKPSSSQKASERQKLADAFSKLADQSLELKALNHKLKLIQSSPDVPIVTGVWKSIDLNMKLTNIFFLHRLANKDILVFGSNGQNEIMYLTFVVERNEWVKHECPEFVLPEQKQHHGEYFYVEARHCIYYIFSSTTTKRLEVATFDCNLCSWLPDVAMNGDAHFLNVGYAVHKENIYCFGGQSGNFKLMNDLCYFDTKQGMWHSIPQSRLVPKPAPRSKPLLFSMNNTLFLTGGMDDEGHPIEEAFEFNEELASFSLVSSSINFPSDYTHVNAITNTNDDIIIGCYRSMMNLDAFHWTMLDSKQRIDFSSTSDTPMEDASLLFYDQCLAYSMQQNKIFCLDELQYHQFDSTTSSEDQDKLFDKIEIEQYVSKKSTKRFVKDLGVVFLDNLLAKMASLLQNIDIKKVGVLIILISTIVYFIVLAVGCYIMVYVNWLGVIGTTTYGVMGLLSYVTLMIQLYIQSKRKVYLDNDISYRSRITYVAFVALLIGSVATLLIGTGVVFALSTIENVTDRVGVMLIMSIFFIGMISNMLRLALNLVWAPARQKNKVLSLLERPWFPHFFKYPLFIMCWAEIGVMCWILIMYSIKFHEDNMTPDWLIACFFGNSQNFLLDQTLVFITTTFVMVTVLQFFEALIRPRPSQVVVLTDEDETNMSDTSSDIAKEFHPIYAL